MSGLDGLDGELAREIDELAWQAEQAWRRGELEQARRLYAQAAELEDRAALACASEPIAVRSWLAVSAVALWYKAGRWADMQRAAHRWLADEDRLDADARAQLRDLLQRGWIESQLDPAALEQTLPVELRLRGGEVQQGFAPAKLARVAQARLLALLERIAAWMTERSARERGASQLEILPAPAGSHGLRLYLRSTNPELATARLLARAFELAQLDVEGWAETVPDPRERRVLLELLRDLCADGEQVDDVVCACPSWRLRLPELHLDLAQRERFIELLEQLGASTGLPEQLDGWLTGVNLAARRPSIDLRDEAGDAARLELGDVDCDWSAILGPLLDKRVRVELRTEQGRRVVARMRSASTGESYRARARAGQSIGVAEDDE